MRELIWAWLFLLGSAIFLLYMRLKDVGGTVVAYETKREEPEPDTPQPKKEEE